MEEMDCTFTPLVGRGLFIFVTRQISHMLDKMDMRICEGDESIN
jgi:hypothetical protein